VYNVIETQVTGGNWIGNGLILLMLLSDDITSI